MPQWTLTGDTTEQLPFSIYYVLQKKDLVQFSSCVPPVRNISMCLTFYQKLNIMLR